MGSSKGDGGLFDQLPPPAAAEFTRQVMTIVTFDRRATEIGTIGMFEAQMTPYGDGEPIDPLKYAEYLKAQAVTSRTLAKLQAELAEAFERAAEILEENFAT